MGIPVHLHALQEQADKSLRYTIYQILWKTKYFNTVKEESLKYVLLIKEFGIPDDYRYDETSSCSGKMPSKLKKIILIESNKCHAIRQILCQSIITNKFDERTAKRICT
jgi:hypothetical protein